jgi:hypothetical protein
MLKLVYGCLAFTAIALVVIIITARDERGSHGFNDPMAYALIGGADVLAADRNGAITQTGNGVVRGFNAGGEKVWETTFDRFAGSAAQPGVTNVPDAAASCAGDCPAAAVTLPEGVKTFGGMDPGSELERTVAGLNLNVLAAFAPNAILASDLSTVPDSQLHWIAGNSDKSLDVFDPSYAGVDGDGDRAIIGAAKGLDGRLYPIKRSGDTWVVAGPEIRQHALRNACISRDGNWVGSAGERIEVRRFGGENVTTVGPPVVTGNCTIDSSGITAVYGVPDSESIIRVTRFTLDGRVIWKKSLGANKLVSHADASSIVVRGGANGTTTAIDARTGEQTFQHALPDEPYVATDGSIVTADRHGNPIWQVVGGG